MVAGARNIWKVDLIQAVVLFYNILTGLQHSIMRTGLDGPAAIAVEITLGYIILAPMAEPGGLNSSFRTEAITGRKPSG